MYCNRLVYLDRFAILYLLLSNISRSLGKATNNSSSEVNKSTRITLAYTKLRYDKQYPQIYRRYQSKFPENEKGISLNLKDLGRDITYYERDVDASQITQDDLILEALDITYKHRLTQMMHNYDNWNDRKLSSDPSLTNKSRCDFELSILEKMLNNSSAPMPSTIASFFDAYANDEVGLLFGNYYWIGDWRKCSKNYKLNLSDVSGTSIDFTGRYCVALIKSPKWQPVIEFKIAENNARNYFECDGQEEEYRRYFRIQVGFCLPQSCDSSIIDSQLAIIKKLITHKLNEPYKSYDLDDLFCLPDEESPLRKISTSGRILLSLIIVWTFLVASLTFYDIYFNKCDSKTTTFSKLIMAISLRRNYKRLLSTKSLWKNYNKFTKHGIKHHKIQTVKEKISNTKATDTIFINAFKVISMPFIILGHCGLILQHLNRNPLESGVMDHALLYHLVGGAMFLVDGFFFITGFLITYSLFVSGYAKNTNVLYWLYTIFHRYWRLAPPYLFLYWFTKTLSEHTGSGPTWDYGTSNLTMRAICHHDSWIYSFGLIQNFQPLYKTCIMSSWYIANDFQFYLVTPPLLVLLSRSSSLGWLVTLVLIATCCFLRLHFYLIDTKVMPFDMLMPRLDAIMRYQWDLGPVYLRPHYRIASYLVGILAAHYVFMVLSGKWNSILYSSYSAKIAIQNGFNEITYKPRLNLKKKFAPFIGLYGLSLLIQFMIAGNISDSIAPFIPVTKAKYFVAFSLSVCHTLFGFGFALLVTAMMMGHFSNVRRLLSHPIWTIAAKLNFMAFLIHIEIIYFLVQSSGYLYEYNLVKILPLFLQVTALTFLGSLVLTLLVEMPLAQLEGQFIGSAILKYRKPDNG